MRPVVNYAYAFTFETKFNSLDGIYIVKAIYSYEELVKANINLFEVLYESNSLDKTSFNNDIESIRENDVYKLESVDDSSKVIYIPDIFFKNIPEINVAKYVDLGLAISLGIYKDKDQVTSIIADLVDIIQAKTGISNGAVLFSKADKWLRTTEYENIENTRNTNITDSSNNYTDKIALIKENQQLRDLITYYEDLVKAL
jgi:hypothetical protein